MKIQTTYLTIAILIASGTVALIASNVRPGDECMGAQEQWLKACNVNASPECVPSGGCMTQGSTSSDCQVTGGAYSVCGDPSLAQGDSCPSCKEDITHDGGTTDYYNFPGCAGAPYQTESWYDCSCVP